MRDVHDPEYHVEHQDLLTRSWELFVFLKFQAGNVETAFLTVATSSLCRRKHRTSTQGSIRLLLGT